LGELRDFGTAVDGAIMAGILIRGVAYANWPGLASSCCDDDFRVGRSGDGSVARDADSSTNTSSTTGADAAAGADASDAFDAWTGSGSRITRAGTTRVWLATIGFAEWDGFCGWVVCTRR